MRCRIHSPIVGHLCLLITILSLVSPALIHAELDDLAAEERVKKLPAADLDPALPKETLSTWISRIGGPKAKLFWEVNDCGEQGGDAPVDEDRDLPACVQASLFLADGREFGVLVTVGSWQKGFVGKPAVRQVYWGEGQQTHTLKRLSQIPAEIKNGPTETPGSDATPAERP